MWHGDAGVNYHEMVLAKRPDGEIKAIDVYVYLSGEMASTTMRRVFLALFAHWRRRGIRLDSKDSEFLAHAETLKRMTRGNAEGSYAQVCDAFESLPPSLKGNKAFLLSRLQAAAHLDEESYLEAIDALRTHYPNDASVELVSIDGYLIRKQYNETLGAIERLDRLVGGDPRLALIRAGVYVAQGDHTEARRATRRVIDAEPDFEDSYWTMFEISVFEKKFDESVKWLRVLERKFDVALLDLSEVDGLEEFVASSPYRKWQDSQGD